MISLNPGNRCVLFLMGVAAALTVLASIAGAQIKSHSSREECIKCHPARVNDIAPAGGRHRNVPCVGCHPGHAPESPKPIAQCNRCHLKTKRSHFQTNGCLTCHTNPHTPLIISFKGKEGCLDCHELEREQLRANPSKHTQVGCVTCHPLHRKKPECVQCHKPHPDTLPSVCKQCHNPHMPKLVTYSADIPSQDCGGCHPEPARLLNANTSKHHLIACARCHREKHKMIPTCATCHGTPHAKGIRNKFPKCTQCHNIAHDLNNWDEVRQNTGTVTAPTGSLQPGNPG